MNLTTLGIDLAKTFFSLADMDQRSQVVLRKTLPRAHLQQNGVELARYT